MQPTVRLGRIAGIESHIMRALVALVLLTSAACAGGQQTGDTGKASPQQEAARQSAEYRTQARSLREMADRRQLEADLLAREVGPETSPRCVQSIPAFRWLSACFHDSSIPL